MRNGQPSVGGLVAAFSQRSFAVLTFFLLLVSATPLPTGGLTHIFELIAMLLALEMIAGRDHIWLPDRWLKLSVRPIIKSRAFARLIKWISWTERYARPEFAGVMQRPWFSRFAGLLILLFALGAFAAPWFTGLDTLPSMGVVLISLGIILGSLWVFALGILAGIAGWALILTIGTLVWRLI